jgi:hypothetical protein
MKRTRRYLLAAVASALVASGCGSQGSGRVDTGANTTECASDDCRSAESDLPKVVSSVFSSPFWAGVDMASPATVRDFVNAYESSIVRKGVITKAAVVEGAPFALTPDGKAINGGTPVWSGYRLTVSWDSSETVVSVPLSAGGPDRAADALSRTDLSSLVGSHAVVVVGDPEASPLDRRGSALLAVAADQSSEPIPWGLYLERAVSPYASLDELVDAARS